MGARYFIHRQALDYPLVQYQVGERGDGYTRSTRVQTMEKGRLGRQWDMRGFMEGLRTSRHFSGPQRGQF